MSRFIVHEIYGMSAEDRERFDLGKYADDGALLEDTVTGETYMDGWEPEDATFMRDLGWVPALLNELAEETEAARAEIDRLTAERATLLAPVEGVDVGEMLSDPDRPWLFAPWVDVQARLDVVPTLAREVARLRACIAAAEQTSAKMVSTIEDLHKLWDETKGRLTAERTAETHRHEAAITRLSAVRTALLDETGSAPSITDPPDVWSRAIRAAVCSAKMLAEEAAEKRNCWTCANNTESGGCRISNKTLSFTQVDRWILAHIADDETMPVHTADGCPGWKATP